MKPVSKKIGMIGSMVVALLLAVCVIANIALNRYADTITYYWNLEASISGGNDEQTAALKAQAWQAAKDVTLETADEGVTLLKNENGQLPMTETKLNVFGYAGVSLVYGGAGSGSTSGAIYCENMKESFEAQGFELNEDLWNYYSGVSEGIDSGEWDVFAAGGTDFNFYDAACEDVADYIDGAKAFSDTAVVVLSRIGGEGTDLPLDVEASGCYGGDAGKHYLELQSCEEELLELVCDNFEHVVVLIDSSHPMELGFLEDEAIDAALMIAGPGATGMQGVARILKGDVNPSGHLVDTFAYDLKSAPSFYNMGDCSYSDFELNMSDRYIYFEENIYTGYRWYETAAADGVVVTSGGTTWDYSDYDSIVQYPFGYGLSYTAFDWELVDHQVDGKGGNITCTVKVTNTGSTAGKDVVQLYYAAPYTLGGIEKSAINLGAFAKTGLLQPGESETVELSMVFDDMASFDYAGQGCYVMDAGEYTFTLQTDSHNLKSDGLSFTYHQSDTIIYNDANDGARSTDLIPAVIQQEFIDGGSLETNVSYLSRADFAGTFPQVERRLNPTSIPAEVKARLEANGPGSDILERDDDSVPAPIVGADNGLSVTDLSGADYDDERWTQLVQQLTRDELIQMTGNTGWSTPAAPSVGKGATVDIDGPQGLNGFNFKDTEMNTYASEVLLGMSWNVELAEKMGATYAQEALAWDISGLYAPAMNTHRSPFGARNFEYFSEDPTLAGLLAAAEVTGMQDNGVYVYANSAVIDTAVSSEAGWSWMWVAGNILLIALMIAVFVLLPFRAWCLGDQKQGTVNCVWLLASIASGVVGVIGLVVAVLAAANVQILSWSIGYILTSGTNDTVLMPSVIAAVVGITVFVACMVFGKRIHTTAEKK